jgi:hypothetical protein
MKILKRIIIEKFFLIENKLCSNELKELVMKLLSKKRSDRPTAMELKKGLFVLDMFFLLLL